MTTGPFDVGLIIARLKANVAQFKLVQGCADLATAIAAGGPPQSPCAYVLLAAETSPQSYGSNEVHRQSVRTTVSVVLAVRNYRTAELGAQVTDDLVAIIRATRGAICGWQPGQLYSGFDFTGGRLENYTNATAWWQEAYSVNYFERVIPQP
jgi:hypothetical protein